MWEVVATFLRDKSGQTFKRNIWSQYTHCIYLQRSKSAYKARSRSFQPQVQVRQSVLHKLTSRASTVLFKVVPSDGLHPIGELFSAKMGEVIQFIGKLVDTILLYCLCLRELDLILVRLVRSQISLLLQL